MVQGAPIGPFRAEFAWSHASCIDADEATTGELRLFIGKRLAWGLGLHGVRWHWVDLLEGLAANWGELLYGGWLGQGPPPGGSALDGLEQLEEALGFDEDVGDLEAETALELHDLAHEWAEAHLLSRYMPGLHVPDIAVWSEGGDVKVEIAANVESYPRAVLAEALTTVGDAIASRLRCQGFATHDAVVAWEARRAAPCDAFAASVTGETPARLFAARGCLSEAQAWGDAEGAMGTTACLAAAAAARGAGQEVLGAAVRAAAKLGPASEGWLECLEAARQAEQAAGWAAGALDLELASGVRGILELSPSQPLQLEGLARVLGLATQSHQWGPEGPVAIALGSPSMSPRLLLNSDVAGPARVVERRWIAVAATVGALRAGAAHQPWAARFGLPGPGEGDNRLALELLVPGEGLIDFILGLEHEDGALKAACRHFGVPLWAIARQLDRSPGYLSVSLREQARAVLEAPGKTPARYLRVVGGGR